jgi:hypothetical protein
MASVVAMRIRGVRTVRSAGVAADSTLPAVTAVPAGNPDPIDATTAAAVVDHCVTSPRTSRRDAPITDQDPTAWIGAAVISPRVSGTLVVPIDTRVPIYIQSSSPYPPEASTRRDGDSQREVSCWTGTPACDTPHRGTRTPIATESASALCARDTEVVLNKIHVVDDPRDSGARTSGPGVFFTPWVGAFLPCGLATE